MNNINMVVISIKKCSTECSADTDRERGKLGRRTDEKMTCPLKYLAKGSKSL